MRSAANTADDLWRPPPTGWSLSRGEVHVWRASLDVPAPRIQARKEILSADELGRVVRFRFRRDRHRYIVARGLLRTILGGYLRIDPIDIRFEYSDFGKPSLPARTGQAAIRFNVSHSGGLALYAFTLDRDIGVDLERITSMDDAEVGSMRFFSPQEKVQFQALNPSQKREAFFASWTCKEAYIKAKGHGLSLPLDRIRVSLDLRKPAKLLDITGAPQEAARWSLRRLTASPGCAAALAVEGHRFRLACWQVGARQLRPAEQ